MSDSYFATWLAARVKARGMNGAGLTRDLQARGVRVSGQAVSQWLRGGARPNRVTWPKVCDALGVDGAARDEANRLYFSP